jgi:hypothetical protein
MGRKCPNESGQIASGKDVGRPRMAQKKKKSKKVQKPGPKPDVLKLEGDWQSAVRKALSRKPPKQS